MCYPHNTSQFGLSTFQKLNSHVWLVVTERHRVGGIGNQIQKVCHCTRYYSNHQVRGRNTRYCSRLKDMERTKPPSAVWFHQYKVQAVTTGYKSGVPTTLSLGSINLLERLTQVTETFASIYQFIIKGLKEFRTGIPKMCMWPVLS